MLQDTLSELNLRVVLLKSVEKPIGLPLRAAFVQLAGVDKDMQEQCVATYEKVFRRNNKPGSVPPFEHVIDTIHELARREIQMTIATSRRSWSAKALLEEMELIDFMPYILGADEVSNHKPHPEPVLKTLEEQHFKPEETIVVGDTWFDIEWEKGWCAHSWRYFWKRNERKFRTSRRNLDYRRFCFAARYH